MKLNVPVRWFAPGLWNYEVEMLHHFTALEYLDSILRGGLTKGEVPISRNRVLNAVWLTSDIDPGGHGLSAARILTDAEKRIAGVPVSGTFRFPNKRAVRLDIDVEGLDLVNWWEWSKLRVNSRWRKILHDTGGGMVKAKTWYLHFGTIPPARFIQVVRLTE